MEREPPPIAAAHFTPLRHAGPLLRQPCHAAEHRLQPLQASRRCMASLFLYCRDAYAAADFASRAAADAMPPDATPAEPPAGMPHMPRCIMLHMLLERDAACRRRRQHELAGELSLSDAG